MNNGYNVYGNYNQEIKTSIKKIKSKKTKFWKDYLNMKMNFFISLINFLNLN